MRSGASRLPLVVTVAAVLVLVGIVAFASSGSTPSGTGATRPADIVADTVFSLGLVLILVGGVVLVVFALARWKAIIRGIGGDRRGRLAFPLFVLFVSLFGWIAYVRLRDLEGVFPLPELGVPGGSPPAEEGPASEVTDAASGPEFAWLPVLIVLGLAAAAVAAVILADRRRRPALPATERAAAEQIADVLAQSLDDLRSEPDARRAVIAAYARLERALAASGLPRRPPETPQEYVPRILAGLEVGVRPVRTLTDLFMLAKFSQHDVTEEMRNEAISALERIRDELRTAARRRDEEPEKAPVSHERAAAPGDAR